MYPDSILESRDSIIPVDSSTTIAAAPSLARTASARAPAALSRSTANTNGDWGNSEPIFFARASVPGKPLVLVQIAAHVNSTFWGGYAVSVIVQNFSLPPGPTVGTNCAPHTWHAFLAGGDMKRGAPSMLAFFEVTLGMYPDIL